MFRCGITYMVGDGGLTKFWTDIWLGESPLATQYQQIFCAVRRQGIRVQECYGPNGWNWRRICSDFTPHSLPEEAMLTDFKTTLNTFQRQDRCDGIRWRWTSTGVFSVKSMYLFLQSSGVMDERFIQLWKLKLPLKVKIFVWLVLRKKVLTVDVLLKRGWSGADHCVMCPEATESLEHLFLGCAFANNLLTTLLPHCTTIRNITGVLELWRTIGAKSGALQTWELSTIAATWWAVWMERNYRRFEGKKREMGGVLEGIRCHRDLWRANCS